MTRSSTLIAVVSILSAAVVPAAADTIVQEGSLEGPAGQKNHHLIDLVQFDTLGGTRQLRFVRLEFSTWLFAESVTNGAGGTVHATASLSIDYSFLSGEPIADTFANIDVMVDNTGKPVATLYLDTDEPAVEYTQPAQLAPWIGSGGITLAAVGLMTVAADPPGVIEWFAGGLVQYRVIYDFIAVPPCPADLNRDGVVSSADIALLLGAWGGAGGDVTGDGITDAFDIAALLAAWGPC
jgi:hypothetical protein